MAPRTSSSPPKLDLSSVIPDINSGSHGAASSSSEAKKKPTPQRKKAPSINWIETLCDEAKEGKTDYTKLFFELKEEKNDSVAEISINDKNKLGATPLYTAASYGKERVVDFLLLQGVDVNTTTKGGLTALDSAIEEWSKTENPKLYKRIVESILKNTNITNETIINASIRLFGLESPHIDSVKAILDKCTSRGISLDKVRNRDGDNILHAAARKNLGINTSTIIDRRVVNIDAVNSYGQTALHLAVLSKGSDAVSVLMQKGANTNIKYEGKTALHLAAKVGNVNAITVLLDASYQNKSNVNETGSETDCNNYTALHYAARNNQLESLQYLLNECKADSSKTNSRGFTFWFFLLHHPSSLLQLLKNTENRSETQKHLGSDATILHYAAHSEEFRKESITAMLASKKFNEVLDWKDSKGLTPFQLTLKNISKMSCFIEHYKENEEIRNKLIEQFLESYNNLSDEDKKEFNDRVFAKDDDGRYTNLTTPIIRFISDAMLKYIDSLEETSYNSIANNIDSIFDLAKKIAYCNKTEFADDFKNTLKKQQLADPIIAQINSKSDKTEDEKQTLQTNLAKIVIGNVGFAKQVFNIAKDLEKTTARSRISRVSASLASLSSIEGSLKSHSQSSLSSSGSDSTEESRPYSPLSSADASSLSTTPPKLIKFRADTLRSSPLTTTQTQEKNANTR